MRLISTLILLGIVVCGVALCAHAQVATPSPASTAVAAAAASTGFLSWIETNMTWILGFLFALSEALALIPAVKANSVFQLIFNALQSLVSKSQTPAA